MMSLDDDDLKGEQKNKNRFVVITDGKGVSAKIYETYAPYARFFTGVFDDPAPQPQLSEPVKAQRPRTLPYLAEYLEHRAAGVVHKPIIHPVPSTQIRDAVPCQWCAAFADSLSDLADLLDLLVVANYLSCVDLTQLCATKLTVQMLGKDKPQLRLFLGCESDYTPQEEAEARATHADLFKDDAPATEGKTDDDIADA